MTKRKNPPNEMPGYEGSDLLDVLAVADGEKPIAYVWHPDHDLSGKPHSEFHYYRDKEGVRMAKEAMRRIKKAGGGWGWAPKGKVAKKFEARRKREGRPITLRHISIWAPGKKRWAEAFDFLGKLREEDQYPPKWGVGPNRHQGYGGWVANRLLGYPLARSKRDSPWYLTPAQGREALDQLAAWGFPDVARDIRGIVSNPKKKTKKMAKKSAKKASKNPKFGRGGSDPWKLTAAQGEGLSKAAKEKIRKRLSAMNDHGRRVHYDVLNRRIYPTDDVEMTLRYLEMQGLITLTANRGINITPEGLATAEVLEEMGVGKKRRANPKKKVTKNTSKGERVENKGIPYVKLQRELKSGGFSYLRSRGSHDVYESPTGKHVTIPRKARGTHMSPHYMKQIHAAMNPGEPKRKAKNPHRRPLKEREAARADCDRLAIATHQYLQGKGDAQSLHSALQAYVDESGWAGPAGSWAIRAKTPVSKKGEYFSEGFAEPGAEVPKPKRKNPYMGDAVALAKAKKAKAKKKAKKKVQRKGPPPLPLSARRKKPTPLRAANPKMKASSKKKVARKKVSPALSLIAGCQRKWASYCARPSKKRLQIVLDHLEKMKVSKAKSVVSERRRCLRSANLEAKRLKVK